MWTYLGRRDLCPFWLCGGPSHRPCRIPVCGGYEDKVHKSYRGWPVVNWVRGLVHAPRKSILAFLYPCCLYITISSAHAILYYFDQLFMGCDMWPLVFTGRGVRCVLWPVTWQKKVFIGASVHSILRGPLVEKFFFEIKLFSSQCSQPAVTCDNCPSVQFTRACDAWHEHSVEIVQYPIPILIPETSFIPCFSLLFDTHTHSLLIV